MDTSTITIPTSRDIQRIWGSPDAMMLIFTGAAAEFAVNRAVDWLFWTNALPSDPIKRFFDTIRFAQTLAFGDQATVTATVERINRIHGGVERHRGAAIPPWAYRDVLFMLQAYGEIAHEIVYGPLSTAQRAELWGFSRAIGLLQHIPDLPLSYADYLAERAAHLEADTAHTAFTDQLYASYEQALGARRIQSARAVQATIVPARVSELLGLQRKPAVDWLLARYHRLPGGGNKLRWLHPWLLPKPYVAQLATLARAPEAPLTPQPRPAQSQ